MKASKYFYRRSLPHYLPNDRPYFLTFRLAASTPVDHERLALLSLKRKFLEYDRILDTMRSGPHHLRDPRIAAIVSEAIHYRDKKDYELHAFTIMSNHIHMVITLADGVVLPEMLQSLKARTARKCNQVLGLRGEFWMHEGYDHVIRKGKFGRVVLYVLLNPVKAGLVKSWRNFQNTYLSPDLQGFD